MGGRGVTLGEAGESNCGTDSRGKRNACGGGGGQALGGGEGLMSSGKAAMKLRAQIKSKLSRARYFENMLDAYQQVVIC